MRNLNIYFNEISFKFNPISNQWDDIYSSLFKIQLKAIEKRKDIKFFFDRNSYISTHDGVPLITKARTLILGKEYYRLLLIHLNEIHEDPPDNIEVILKSHKNEKNLLGPKLSFISDSWLLSAFTNFPSSSSATLDIECDSLEADGTIRSESGFLKHISCLAHLEEWEQSIKDWGYLASSSCIIKRFGRHPLAMFPGPKEHNPPHVHLLLPDSHETLAKYRIDEVLRLKGRDNEYDSAIMDWIREHKNELLASWEKCQAGGLPYNLE